jgi:uncharacterized protein YycO
MAQLKIIFSTTKKIGSKFINWHQRAEYSHCEVLFDDYIIGARSTGVKRFPLDSVSKIHEVAIFECSDEQAELFYEFMESKVGDGYDWMAYWGLLANEKSSQDQDKWFCSELMLSAFNHAGIKVFDRLAPWKCMPRDFVISPMFLKDKSRKVTK